MKRPALTMGSMFAGIGGFDVAAKWNGWETRWAIEINPFCRQVLRRRFPFARILKDARKVNYAELEPVDVMCGGFPCQRHSSATSNHKRDTRHDEDFLWPTFADAIRVVKPRYVVVENVPNIIRDGTLAIILRDLAALGYDAEWDVISAALVGANHRRERAWIVAYRRGLGAKRPRPRQRPRKAIKEWSHRTSTVRSFAKTPFAARGRIPQPLIRRMDDGFQERVDRLKALGNAVVPQVVLNYPFRWINKMEKTRLKRLARLT